MQPLSPRNPFQQIQPSSPKTPPRSTIPIPQVQVRNMQQLSPRNPFQQIQLSPPKTPPRSTIPLPHGQVRNMQQLNPFQQIQLSPPKTPPRSTIPLPQGQVRNMQQLSPENKGDSLETTMTISTKKFYANATPSCSYSTKTFSVTPEHIIPLPHAEQKKHNNNRRKGKTAILTSTPYKKELEDVINNSRPTKKVKLNIEGNGKNVYRGKKLRKKIILETNRKVTKPQRKTKKRTKTGPLKKKSEKNKKQEEY
ncbi:hypothetical protein NQ317_017560 [Molorchus minor]|uniref:Uncharacterized protein n=1 Tax=Molorchus minor TaxID=1323400 RepID=A0ABQ9J3A1_9CUCU|nr:hypothetical protein NQ317_017560 [Molorchus minor]